MPKPNVKADEKKLDSKQLPDLVEVKFDGWEEALLLMERLDKLQQQVGRKPDLKKNKAGAGLLAEIDSIKSQLSAIMAVAGVDGMRHNNLAFTDCYIDGRKSMDLKALKIELVQAGCDLAVVNECFEKCEKQGDGYVRRMLVDLNKPRGDWGDD